jgi:hypothetical protein
MQIFCKNVSSEFDARDNNRNIALLAMNEVCP